MLTNDLQKITQSKISDHVKPVFYQQNPALRGSASNRSALEPSISKEFMRPASFLRKSATHKSASNSAFTPVTDCNEIRWGWSKQELRIIPEHSSDQKADLNRIVVKLKNCRKHMQKKYKDDINKALGLVDKS